MNLLSKSRRKVKARKLQKARRKSAHREFYESLEARHLLAGIFFDAPTGFVTVAGDASANVGQFTEVSGLTVQATLDGLSRDFDKSLVTKIIFIGFGGDDQFFNATSIDGLLLGNDGNDILSGGSGSDQINGGPGNDQITGNYGMDRLIAGPGNDTLLGGNDNDAMFGNSGTNSIQGEAGDDLIFGGTEVDTIDGGDGIDQIFAGAGNDILFSGTGGVAGSAGIAQADLILGLDGDDSFTGDAGLNVFYGGNGNDTMVGGSGENRMHGQNGMDTLTGGPLADYLAGNNDSDVINGLGGSDFILPGFGDDTINGGAGKDFVVLAAYFDNYQISGTSEPITVTDLRGIDGTKVMSESETIRFVDGDHPTAPGVTHVVTIQPIQVSNDNGSNTAEFFGNAEQAARIKQMVDEILFQAGVDVVWLDETLWNNTFANVGDGGERSGFDLDTITQTGDDAGVGNSNPDILDMYFVEIAAGFSDTGENTANGLAYVGYNGITMHVGDRLVSNENDRWRVASVAAHEIAHNLGLDHVNDPGNLMFDGNVLTASQTFRIRNSQYAKRV